jgi:hypothetical protein
MLPVTSTPKSERLRKTFAVAAALVVDGHVKHSDAYDVTVTPYEVKIQGGDADAMQFVARELRILGNYELAPNGFHRWHGQWRGAHIVLAANGPLSDHTPDVAPEAAVKALAAEVTS